MKFVIDSAIPFIKGLFEPYAEVVYFDAREINPEDIKDADALIIRSRTKCNRTLLEGSSIKLISTATIGTDHIDSQYCKEKGIFVTNASGSNAGGVMNYVFSALYGTAARKTISLENANFGIIGLGQTGSRVESVARYFGFNVLKYDSPRAVKEGFGQYVSLDRLLLKSDIISLHLPLTEESRRMCNAEFFAKMKPGAIFINTSHGDLIDEQALIDASTKLGPIIIDTWSNEPQINKRLLNVTSLATPHIAGYSYQGKQNGTAAVVRSTARFFGIKELFDYFPEAEVSEMESIKLDLSSRSQGEIASVLQYNYPIFTDDFIFRLNVDGFETIRSSYPYRREFFFEF